MDMVLAILQMLFPNFNFELFLLILKYKSHYKYMNSRKKLLGILLTEE